MSMWSQGETHHETGPVKISRWLPPSFPFTLAGSLLIRLPLAPLSNKCHRHQRFQASLREKSKIRNRVAIHW